MELSQNELRFVWIKLIRPQLCGIMRQSASHNLIGAMHHSFPKIISVNALHILIWGVFIWIKKNFVIYCDVSVKSKFCHSLMYPYCYIATQFSQYSTTSNSRKMPWKRHFTPLSVFGVSISQKCSFVQAQSHFWLLTLTSTHNYIINRLIMQWRISS